MECHQVQRKFPELRENSLSKLERQDLEKHLQQCQVCSSERTFQDHLFKPPTVREVPELAELPAMLERVRSRLASAYNEQFSSTRLQDFNSFRRSAINQLKLSLAAASDEDVAAPLIGRLEAGPNYYVVYFTRERNELHLDFIDKQSKRSTSALDGAVVSLNGGQASTKIANGSARLALADLIDASEMTIKLPGGAEIRIS